jgi:hypothetical protein
MTKRVTLEGETNQIKRKVLNSFILKLLDLEVIKDGVDILTMNENRDPADCESTLELILNTLCRAF